MRMRVRDHNYYIYYFQMNCKDKEPRSISYNKHDQKISANNLLYVHRAKQRYLPYKTLRSSALYISDEKVIQGTLCKPTSTH